MNDIAKRKKMKFKKGDKYIHFTKYGGVNMGEVEWSGVVTIIDGKQGLYYDQYYIRTTKGISLMLDGSDGKVCKITHTMTEKEKEDYEKMGKYLYAKQYNAIRIGNAIHKSIRKFKEE